LHSLKSHDSMVLDSVIHVNGLFSDTGFSRYCRYPSPVSITATLPPSNSSSSTSENPNVHSHKSERHPLPPRPPVEFCLDDSLPQEIKHSAPSHCRASDIMRQPRG
ncbi:unnamed protein product, partial [Penicillium nalgiovense]